MAPLEAEGLPGISVPSDADVANMHLIAAAPDLLDACCYALRRVQTDPDFCHHMLATETMAKLCRAVAVATEGVMADVDAFERRCSEDKQPDYRRRKPRLVVAQERIEELEQLCHEHGIDGF